VWSIKAKAAVAAGWGVEKIAELNQQTGPIKALSLHPSKDWCASSSDDGSCVVWDLKSLKYIGLVLPSCPCLSLSLSLTHTLSLSLCLSLSLSLSADIASDQVLS
jgi:WD40 repeat protein